ncbi:hypothetical protein ACQ4PT_038804 [Festuca glaucescens]
MGKLPNPDSGVQRSDSSGCLYRSGSSSSGNHGPRPKMNFPVFSGERPKSWKRQSEAYFRVFSVQPEHWVDTASIHFTGAAQLWLENCGLEVENLSWEELCALVCDQFGRDEFQKLLRQLFHVKQTGTVPEYVQEFTEVMHALKAHSSAWDPELFPSRFVDGLKDEIRVVVLVHQPKDLDAAVSLALLQEEAWEIWRKKDTRRAEPAYFPKASYRATTGTASTGERGASTPVAAPSPYTAPRHASMTEDKRGQEAARETAPTHAVERAAALKAYRRARNLCFICGERYSPGHKCATTVQLHVVQEMLDAMGFDALEEASTEPTNTAEMLAISEAAVTGTEAPSTFRLLGQIQKKKVLMLIDSGSSHCFVNEAIATELQGTKTKIKPVQVKIADGAIMTCDTELVDCEWWSQRTTFKTNMKVLPLGGYDMIIGMDWLQSHNPMGIDWVGKRLAFWNHGKLVLLKGEQASVGSCKEVDPRVLINLMQHVAGSDIVEVRMIEEDTEAAFLIPSEIAQVLAEFEAVFAEPDGLPPARQFDHSIPLVDGAKPVNLRPYRYSPAQKYEIEKQIASMLRHGIIRPSCSPFASPVLLVLKKDLTWRFCIDYRHLNAITVKNRYPLPIIEELIDELAGAQWFTSLDLRAGYHQIRMQPGDEEKTAFKTHNGHYEFRVMSFGLTGAPTTFQNTMNTILAPVLRKGVLVFIDDILVYRKTLEEHAQLLKKVFMLLDQHHLKVKKSKCTFAQPQLVYLGHVISASGVATDPKNISAVQRWNSPKSVKEVRGFLGLAGYYRKFVRNFGQISKPLTDLLKKDKEFHWTATTEAAFRQLQQALIAAPVLAILDFAKPFVVETDASDGGVGAILSHEGHPISYLSRALGPKNQGLSAYEKEFLAILLAVDHWRSYLQVQEFTIQSDHRSLASLDEQRLHTPWQRKALTKLLGLRYKIVYRPGKENGAADALSRKGDNNELVAMSISMPVWLTEVLQSYNTDATIPVLLQKINVGDDAVKEFSVKDGLILKDGRIWLGNNAQLQQKILQSVHDSPVGGHSGVRATCHRLHRNFAWTGMKKAVEDYVEHCTVCKQAKHEKVMYPGLLQPLATPRSAWHTVTLDFIEGLPRSRNANCIMVVVAKLTRYAHFVALAHPFSAYQVAIAYVDNIFKLHSLPEVMVSDRDPIFNSRLWRELFKLVGTELAMSSSRHPQTDRQTERVNQCLEMYLRCFVHSCPRQLRHWLPLAEYWYNTSFHTAIQTSPFEALYGHQPRHFGVIDTTVCQSADLATWLEERSLMQGLLKQHLERARQIMKDQADKKRSDRQFAVGDWVFLKVQPYVQNSVADRASHKLAFRYFGPFQVLARVGEVSYQLDLPERALIHPVVHVSLLRRAQAPASADQIRVPPPPPAGEEARVQDEPAQVLQRRQYLRGSMVRTQALVQWSSLPESLATWEDEAQLRARFPRAPAWGQAGHEGRANVTPVTPTPHAASPARRVPLTESVPEGPRRSRRERRPNVRLDPKTWDLK